MLKINFSIIDLIDLSNRSTYFPTMKYSLTMLDLNITYEIKWSSLNSSLLTYKNGDF